MGYPRVTHSSTTPPMPINGNAKGVVSSDVRRHFARFPPPSHFGPIMPTTLGKTTPPEWTSTDHAKEQTDAARGSMQGAAEY